MSKDKDMGVGAGAPPLLAGQAVPPAACTARDIQRASNIVCGASVKASVGKWFAYRGSSAYIPNYWYIESDDYPDGGFSICGYIHDSDARLIAAAPDLLVALKKCKYGAEYPDELGDIVDAAISKAEAR